MASEEDDDIEKTLDEMVADGLVEYTMDKGEKRYFLTKKGQKQAASLIKQLSKGKVEDANVR